MTNSQREEGFTAVANELLEHIVQTKLNGTQFRVLLFVIRRTCGFQKKTAEMSLSFIANGVGIHRNSVYATLRQLEAMKIISITHMSATTPQRITVETDYQKWFSADSTVNKSVDSTVNESVDSTVNESIDSTVNESVDSTVNESVDSTVNESIDSITAAVNESVDSTVNESVDSAVNESVYQKRKREINIEKNILCACPFFETLWAEYPNKKGKAKVTQKAMGEMNRLGYGRMHRALERYRTEKPEWQHWQNGSTFFNGGYLDYLDEAPGKEQTNGADDTDGPGDNWKRFFERCRI